jgi:hypothetical protein
MTEEKRDRDVGSVRTWEVVVASLFLAFGAIVMWDSKRLGASWADDGPQAGYFPFYIGVLICGSAIANLITAFGHDEGLRKGFVSWQQLRLVLIIMIPSTVYVFFIANPWMELGIYVASAIYIAFFMRYLASYSWGKIAAVSIGTMVTFFVMFEIWFKVPLPKGPLETWLGFN